MAASLSFLRQLSNVTRAVCLRCGNAVKQGSARTTYGEQKKVMTTQIAMNRPFSSAQAGEETGEPDDLYRQITVEVKGHDKAVLKSYNQFVTLAADELGLNLARVFEPPKVIMRYTLLKSVHIYAKHMVQYEARTHYNVFEFKHLTGSTADTFLEYIQRNLPEGVAMKVTKHKLEKIPDHLQPPKCQPDLEVHLQSKPEVVASS